MLKAGAGVIRCQVWIYSLSRSLESASESCGWLLFFYIEPHATHKCVCFPPTVCFTSTFKRELTPDVCIYTRLNLKIESGCQPRKGNNPVHPAGCKQGQKEKNITQPQYVIPEVLWKVGRILSVIYFVPELNFSKTAATYNTNYIDVDIRRHQKKNQVCSSVYMNYILLDHSVL